MTPPVSVEDLREGARAVLEANWREGVSPDGRPFGYTRPSRHRYPEQFFWDSCLHAVSWSVHDPARAREELRSLAAAQHADGLIGHTIFWNGRVRLSRRFLYNVIGGDDRSTATIQPPLLGWAWAEVADRSPDDPAFRAEGIAPTLALHEWLERERADDDGLIGILQPDESGLDATPTYDRVLGTFSTHARPGYVRLIQFNRRRGYRYRQVVADGGLYATDVLVNAAWALGWSGLARLGHPGAAERAAAITEALVRRLHDPETGFFYAEGPHGERLRVSTWAGLAPLALEHLPEGVGRRLAEEHLLDPGRYWLPYPVPSTSLEERAFRPGRQGLIPRYWRGPTWLFSSVFVLMGLIRMGYREQAEDLVARTARLVRGAGFREYYHPFRGTGLGTRDFSVSTIAVELADRLREAG